MYRQGEGRNIVLNVKLLHKSISHNVWTGKNMPEINLKAFRFLLGENLT